MFVIARTNPDRGQKILDAPAVGAIDERDDMELPSVNADASPTGHARSPHTEMLGIVAHEMRNALHPIRLAAALLGSHCEDEAQRRRVRLIIERQVARLSQLVGDVLDTCRADSGTLRLESGPVNLARVVADAIDDCQAGVASRGQRLRAHLPARVPTVQGDAGRLAQVMANLLANASKYTPPGGTIDVSVVQTKAALQLTVADNGIGIAPEVLPHVFEPFVQDPRAVAFDGSGMGLGLCVVRELVRAHGGDVVAHSAGPGSGTRFVVTLPVATAARAAKAPPRPVPSHSEPALPARPVAQHPSAVLESHS